MAARATCPFCEHAVTAPTQADALLRIDVHVAVHSPFIDEVAVERAMTGVPVTLTRAEKVVTARRLRAAGRGIRDVAAALRISFTAARDLTHAIDAEDAAR